MKSNHYKIGIAAMLLVAGSAVSFHAFAQSATPTTQNGWNQGSGMHMRGSRAPGVFGTVTAISGNTITITSTNRQTSAVTTYTIDASNAKVDKNRLASTVSTIAVGDQISVEGTVSGTNVTATQIHDSIRMQGEGARGVFGKVTAVSGTTITVTGKNATYSVNASNATVKKDGATSTVSAIAVGDTVTIEGSVSGTSVTATNIFDGMQGNKGANPLASFTGNGEPVIGGTVSSISGSTLSITNSSGATYTIDASNAKITANGSTSATISNVAVGDSIIAQGTISGTSVTATSVIDRGAAPSNVSTANESTNVATPSDENHPGFFGDVGGFFKKLFGF